MMSFFRGGIAVTALLVQALMATAAPLPDPADPATVVPQTPYVSVFATYRNLSEGPLAPWPSPQSEASDADEAPMVGHQHGGAKPAEAMPAPAPSTEHSGHAGHGGPK